MVANSMIQIAIGLFFSVGALIAGIAFLSVYGVKNAQASALTPETTFQELSDLCNITAVFYEEKSESGECYDIYTYTFLANFPSGSVNVYDSAAQKLYRRDGECSDSDEPIIGSYQVGETVSCYHPTDGQTKDDLPDIYTCGNPECVKVLDPIFDVVRARQEAEALLYSGIPPLVAGIFATLTILFFPFVCRK